MALAQSPLGEKVKLCTKDSMFILVTKFTKEVCLEFVLRSCRQGQGHRGGGVQNYMHCLIRTKRPRQSYLMKKAFFDL